MYQVKKQLQDAIKKLKADWGINEVKREDLAAVLDKVVAALDRAAQLPLAPAPAGRDFDKHFCRAVVVGFGEFQREDRNATGTCYPAIGVVQTGPLQAYDGFFEPRTRNLYTRNQNGLSFEEVTNGRMCYNRKSFFYLGGDGYQGSRMILGAGGSNLGGDEIKDDIDNPNWEF